MSELRVKRGGAGVWGNALLNAAAAVVALGIGIAAGQPAMKFARMYAGLSPAPVPPMLPHRTPNGALASTNGGQPGIGANAGPTPAAVVAVVPTPTSTPAPTPQPTPEATPTPSSIANIFSPRGTPDVEEEKKSKKILDDAVSKARKKTEELKNRK